MTARPPAPGIRRARASDVPRLKELGVLGWETTYHEYVRPANRRKYLDGDFWSLAMLARVASDPACLVVVWQDDEGVVQGFASVEPYAAEPSKAELTRFYVDPAARGSGIGQALFDACRTWCRERGTPALLINVFGDNHRGRAFYERQGARLIRDEPTWVGDQLVADVWYELELR